MRQTGRVIDRFILYLSYIGAAVALVSVILIVLLVSLNVALRYIFNAPLMFVEEYSAYLFITLSYMAFAYTAIKDKHVSVDLVVGRFPKRLRNGLDSLLLLITLVLVGVYFRYAWKLCMNSLVTQHKSDTVIATPLWIPQVIMLIGLIFFGLAIASLMVKKATDLGKGSREDVRRNNDATSNAD